MEALETLEARQTAASKRAADREAAFPCDLVSCIVAESSADLESMRLEREGTEAARL